MTQSNDSSLREHFGCLGQLLAKLGIAMPDAEPEATGDEPLPYGISDRFMSKAELAFYRVLMTVVDREAVVVCVKVRMADVLYVKRPNENRGARNRIDRKHVDFLLADAATMRPRVAIELDDRSHGRKSRQDRDAFVDRAYAAAGLPVLHVRCSDTYHTGELKAQIDAALSAGAA